MSKEVIYEIASDVCDQLGDHRERTFDIVVWGLEGVIDAVWGDERTEADNKLEVLLSALRHAKIQERLSRGQSVSVADVEVDVDISRIRSELKMPSPNPFL